MLEKADVFKCIIHIDDGSDGSTRLGGGQTGSQTGSQTGGQTGSQTTLKTDLTAMQAKVLSGLFKNLRETLAAYDT